MGLISTIVQTIRTAVFGRDVRGAIADGIEQIGTSQEKLETTFNSLVINAGDSNAEIVVARGGFPQLNDRLESMENEASGDLIEHIDDTNNPHKVTLAQLGGDPLPILRGGTGVSSLSALICSSTVAKLSSEFIMVLFALKIMYPF